MARYDTIYAFGDSLSDAGNDSIVTGASNLFGITGRIPNSPPYYQTSYGPFGTLTANVFSNGPVWVQDLSQLLGFGTLEPSLYGGNDYAYGGSEADPTESGISGIGASAISLNSQLSQYGGGADSSALYTVSIGTNDIQTILGKSGFDLDKQVQQVQASVADEVSFVSSLVSQGARNFLVVDVPDMSVMPVVTKNDSASQIALAGRLSFLYDVDLNTALQGLSQSTGASISVLPLYTLSDEAVANPSAFGLSNVTDPAWTGNYSDPNSGTVAANPNSYLFWDQYHPTGYVQQLIANDASTLLNTGTAQYSTPSVDMADITTGQISVQFTTLYPGASSGSGLQDQFIYPGLDGVAVTANGPNMFLKGGAGTDVIQGRGGTNVLDGGTGLNIVSGTPYSTDTFFVDGRGGNTWDTVLHFHQGDTATLWGFRAGTSTLTSNAVDGAAGMQGVTFYSQLGGAGTALNAALTLTGIDPGTAAAHFTLTAGALNSGTSSEVDYLLIAYDH